MINLFKRIYLNYDVDLRAGKTQQRIFITNRELPYPITSDFILRQKLGIAEHYRTPEEFLDEFGGLSGAIKSLLQNDGKICLISSHEFVTLLHTCVVKSLWKNPDRVAAYNFYKATYAHQRSSSLQTLTNYDDDAKFKTKFPDMFTFLEFVEIYNRAEVCDELKTIDPSQLPIELLMGNYFSDGDTKSGTSIHFLFKYRAIALENAIFRIRVLRNDILTNNATVSQYLQREVDEIHAVDELLANPSTAWLGDEDLALYSEENAIKKYSIAQLIEIYDSIEKLLGIKIEERRVLEYIARGEISELVQEDIKDERGNFIGTEHHFAKVNSVFINKCYQEYRAGNTEFFTQFQLIDEIDPHKE